MSYTNDIRQAVQSIDNPTTVGVDISVKDEQIFLIMNREELLQLNQRQFANLRAYLKDIKDVIRTGGGGEPQLVVL